METEYENKCRVRYYEVAEGITPKGGYSRSQLGTVMVILGCDVDGAVEVLQKTETAHEEPDWSEWSWTEFRDYFQEVVSL